MENQDPKQSIGFLIYEVSRLMRRDFNARVRSLGLTQAQWRALVYITRFEGCNQATLAEMLEIKPITLTRHLDRLQEAGWLERRPDPGDRRAVNLYLTEKAKPLLVAMQQKGHETKNKALHGLSREEVASLIVMLTAIKKNFTHQVD